jgi:prolyl-tRNA synthetase
MYQFKDHSDREVGLGFSHEEVVVDILSRQPLSYNDFPYKLYQFQTKFRHEPRAKSGILRGREFLMKDLYSAHVDEADFQTYYDSVRLAYSKIFDNLGIRAVETLASGGVFSDNFSHEFQVISPVGEDEIYICKTCNKAVNKEVLDKVNRVCPHCQSSDLIVEKAIEVGNTFNLGTYYSDKMEVRFVNEDGIKKPFWFASYGIGISRAMGTIVEMHHDDKGIIWPASVAPMVAHLVGLDDRGEGIYNQLTKSGIKVLYDDRTLSAGQKFADADLLGMPVRLTVGAKTPQGEVEWRDRATGETQTMNLQGATNRLLVLQLEQIEKMYS